MFEQHYADHYDRLNKNKPYKEEIKFVFDWANKPTSILDLGCGTASYWKYFPSYVRLVGLEKSTSMIRKSHKSKMIFQGDICDTIFELFYPYNCVTALFDVMNYIPHLNWIDKIPLKKGKFFIFDVLQKKRYERFKRTERRDGYITRIINPIEQVGNKVSLNVMVKQNFKIGARNTFSDERHELFLWSEKDIEKAAKNSFEIIETKTTETWQKWYKLRKK